MDSVAIHLGNRLDDLGALRYVARRYCPISDQIPTECMGHPVTHAVNDTAVVDVL